MLEEGHLQFKTKKHLYLLKTSAILSRVNGQDISNAAFIHLRHNVKLNRWMRFEQFAQLQNNPINKVTLRGLLGGGPRFKLLQRKQMALYTAPLIMYEYEKSIFPGQQLHEEHNLRWSAYLTTTIVFFQKLTLVHTTYYQPRVSRMKDYRINSETKIKLAITRHLSFEPGLRYMYDADPVPGIPPKQIFVENALKINF
ncbi:MAG: DUF481 domain-containing protein [Chitinophagaceae bacterium]|nr:DUF481 domain-containing protein [Chitinophagaceae bacterium]